MPPLHIKPDGQPYKVFFFGDLMIQSGFGRIANEITRHVAMRGWNVLGASLQYGGYPFANIGFPVIPLGGREAGAIWQTLAQTIKAEAPDIVVVCQDFPYAITAYHSLGIDWSTTKFVVITPIDGTPIHSTWLDLVDQADATMVISRFGVEAMAQQGKMVDLLHPGVDLNEFYPADDTEEVTGLRTKAGIPADAFVVGSFMMNQGRKMVSKTIEVFGEFAHNKPDAYLYMDMEDESPAGWSIKEVIKQLKWPEEMAKRVLTRANVTTPAVGLLGLRERYLLCTISSQMAHREGFGLPNLESMACKVPPTVLDWCSGSEIAGAGKGILVRRHDYMEMGTWGGARDAFPDTRDWLHKWNHLYRNRDHIQILAINGYEWAKAQTWENAGNQFESVLRRIVTAERKERKANERHVVNHPTPGFADTADSHANPAPILPPADMLGNHTDVHHGNGGANGADRNAEPGGDERRLEPGRDNRTG